MPDPKEIERKRQEFIRVINNAKYGAALGQCLMFVYETSQGKAVFCENPELMGFTPTFTVDPKGVVRKYHKS